MKMEIDKAVAMLTVLFNKGDEGEFNDLLKTLCTDYEFDADELLAKLMCCT